VGRREVHVWTVAGVALALVAAAPVGKAWAPCVTDQEASAPVARLPEGRGIQLVGVAFNKRMEPVVVVRHGDPRVSRSRVYEVGEKVLGWAQILKVGGNSALVRADGRLYVLVLKGRAVQRDWVTVAKRMPRCAPNHVEGG
jgi:hypothetical protein